MPALSTNYVPLSRIKTDDSRSSHDSQLIEELAQLILQGEGLISPLIIEQEPTLLTFRLVSGFLEYHAAMRAREINLEKAENIQAFIIGVDFEESRRKALEAQIAKIKDGTPPPPLPDAVGKALNNLESHFSVMQKDVAVTLESINYASTEVLKGVVSIDRKFDALLPLVPKSQININSPKLTVEELCRVNGIGKKYAQEILDYREQNGGRFMSLNDLAQVPGLSMAKIRPWTTTGAVLVCEDT